MIVFNGDHSEKCAKYICNLHRKKSMIVAILLFVVIELPVAIYSFFYFPFQKLPFIIYEFILKIKFYFVIF